mmetsp:Transcript_13990/g.23253  ORF Transcript_13990/g.23253 Transcript_13990/m.23253 type:complete len:220 (-) Transcript_13990:184-843(-)
MWHEISERIDNIKAVHFALRSRRHPTEIQIRIVIVDKSIWLVFGVHDRDVGIRNVSIVLLLHVTSEGLELFGRQWLREASVIMKGFFLPIVSETNHILSLWATTQSVESHLFLSNLLCQLEGVVAVFIIVPFGCQLIEQHSFFSGIVHLEKSLLFGAHLLDYFSSKLSSSLVTNIVWGEIFVIKLQTKRIFSVLAISGETTEGLQYTGTGRDGVLGRCY